MSEPLDNMQAEVSHHMNEIARLFKDPRITVVVRAPQLTDGDLVMTNDGLDDAIAAIQRLKERADKMPFQGQ